MKGILFTPDNIRAIAEGRKTVTRRVIKPTRATEWLLCGDWADDYIKDPGNDLIKSARYQVSEVVYIKEAHYAYGHWTQFNEEGKSHWEFFRDKETPIHFADTEWTHALTKPSNKEGWYKRSPLFLEEKFARYFIKILDVRHERLQEITEENAVAEGIVPVWADGTPIRHDGTGAICIEAYTKLWDSINPKYPWSSNPWVWRYEFEKVEK